MRARSRRAISNIPSLAVNGILLISRTDSKIKIFFKTKKTIRRKKTAFRKFITLAAFDSFIRINYRRKRHSFYCRKSHGGFFFTTVGSFNTGDFLFVLEIAEKLYDRIAFSNY